MAKAYCTGENKCWQISESQAQTVAQAFVSIDGYLAIYVYS